MGKNKPGRKLARAAYHLSGASITVKATKAAVKAPAVVLYPLLPHKVPDVPAAWRDSGRWS